MAADLKLFPDKPSTKDIINVYINPYKNDLDEIPDVLTINTNATASYGKLIKFLSEKLEFQQDERFFGIKMIITDHEFLWADRKEKIDSKLFSKFKFILSLKYFPLDPQNELETKFCKYCFLKTVKHGISTGFLLSTQDKMKDTCALISVYENMNGFSTDSIMEMSPSHSPIDKKSIIKRMKTIEEKTCRNEKSIEEKMFLEIKELINYGCEVFRLRDPLGNLFCVCTGPRGIIIYRHCEHFTEFSWNRMRRAEYSKKRNRVKVIVNLDDQEKTLGFFGPNNIVTRSFYEKVIDSHSFYYDELIEKLLELKKKESKLESFVRKASDLRVGVRDKPLSVELKPLIKPKKVNFNNAMSEDFIAEEARIASIRLAKEVSNLRKLVYDLVQTHEIPEDVVSSSIDFEKFDNNINAMSLNGLVGVLKEQVFSIKSIVNHLKRCNGSFCVDNHNTINEMLNQQGTGRELDPEGGFDFEYENPMFY